ncbi:hypothetical protein GOARA_056_00790 [Gordonia araii NBRC 100433]|uniref:Uncharacterized protein n=1 Tax=Gordonia araii NBRC 100433 TaxID=1073574 RepID=G7H3A7_9ACTN|nr:hypothetical protein [Gordonia araii]NNG96451.1 hypothetical protein [Gordonia araii NBRC 100433]GAB10332.1 hypothetical protein GOARA_056_00790 [Gordonia araii NBRC 100433]
MPTNLKPAEWRELNAELVPQVGAWLDRHSDLFTVRGAKFVERALAKANLAGETGTRLLFEPVLLVATAVEPADIDELFAVCDRIPFTGDFSQWDYAKAVYAAGYRIYERRGDAQKARHPWLMLSFPVNGGRLAEPFANDAAVPAMMNRANGAGLGISPQYPRPVTTIPKLQHLLGAVREWTIMWALGGSEQWPRERLDADLAEAIANASEFINAR